MWPAAEVILYVSDQQRSKSFYASFLGRQPEVDVPGMTAFNLSPELRLGLMPQDGIAKIICPAVPHPSNASGVPKCELYLRLADADAYFERALKAGAVKIADFEPRGWGETAAYLADPDGHILALAHQKD